MRDALRSFGMPFHAVVGNHDYVSPIDRRPYENLFPGSLNYHFAHRDWQFIGLDSSEGMSYRNTRIQPATLQWLDETLPKLKLPLSIILPPTPVPETAIVFPPAIESDFTVAVPL